MAREKFVASTGGGVSNSASGPETCLTKKLEVVLVVVRGGGITPATSTGMRVAVAVGFGCVGAAVDVGVAVPVGSSVLLAVGDARTTIGIRVAVIAAGAAVVGRAAGVSVAADVVGSFSGVSVGATGVFVSELNVGALVGAGFVAPTVGGTGVSVGGRGVSVGGTGVSVGGRGVSVGGTDVLVGGTRVFVGGTGVFVGGSGVFEGSGSSVSLGLCVGSCVGVG